MRLTAVKLYNFLQCEHRLWRDKYGRLEEKIKEDNPFVKMLWDRGLSHEKAVVSQLGDFLDLSGLDFDQAAQLTIKAMKKKVPLIYQAVLIYQDLFGIPDLLKLQADGTYQAIEIKSGSALVYDHEEKEGTGRQKKSYAVQLGLYVEILMALGFSKKKLASVIDANFQEVLYDFSLPLSSKNRQSYWDFYLQSKQEAILLLKNQKQNKPALSSICSLCPWYYSCKQWLEANDDPSILFSLGRGRRDVLNKDLKIEKITDILSLDIEEIKDRKKMNKEFLKGVGEKTLSKILSRAQVLKERKKPIVYKKINFPQVNYELFFDIENDPTRQFVYLHGVYEKTKNSERFLDFTAKDFSPEAEKQAWADFWQYIKSLAPNDYALYYYSSHEKSIFRKLQLLYPDLISADQLEQFFANEKVIDLYQIVLKYTDWPLSTYSLKSLAQYLGFNWRDKSPSGALSIKWFNDYLEDKDPKKLERILLYNEDDCRATMFLKEALEKMNDF